MIRLCYLTIFIIVLLQAPLQLFAQANCGTDQAMQELFKKHPELFLEHQRLMHNSRMEAAKFNNQSSLNKAGATFIIPIVFHVIHEYGTENLNDAQIIDAVRVLNEDFQALNPDTISVVGAFKPLIGNVATEFRLATKDPGGNCTNGIEHIYSHSTNQGDDRSKLNPWPRDKYLNVWIVKTIGQGGNVAGYAYYPSAVNGWNYKVDGIIILSNYVGSIGTSAPGRSRALTHEIGHYLGLSHTWGSDNSAGVACGDDGILDTPPTSGNLDCSRLLSDSSCGGGLANVQNFMDYSYCYRMFTAGQASLMQLTLSQTQAGRSFLSTPFNLSFTGTEVTNKPACAPMADFKASSQYVCQGGTIYFTDCSWRAIPDTRSWTFTNGTPSTSTAANPSVTFNSPGWQEVSLKVTNAAGSGEILRKQYIYVSSTWSDKMGDLTETFENNNFENLWIVDNPGNDTKWKRTTEAGYSGTGSVMISSSDKLLVDAFITPSVNLLYNNTVALSFRYAAGSYSSNFSALTDQLKIYSSTDCGQTWVARRIITGTELVGGQYNTFFVPNKNTWREMVINLPVLQLKKGNVRFKFEYNSGPLSNNLYIDDINILGSTGISLIAGEDIKLRIYPNPSGNEDILNIAYSLPEREQVSIRLSDITGKELEIMENEMQAAGEKNMAISKSKLNMKPGIYILKIYSGSAYATQKIVVTE